MFIGHAKDYFVLISFTLHIRDSSVCIESKRLDYTISYF
ncbi:hypothetical protein M115_2782 [Bacteroides fragilis str. 3719 T6]|uniref:Uncharacterized protein n=2 Tax=Bacteroides fragilis TaxID=817 RepID=A0A853PQW2_BACFG|nr:hypothetical protein M077_3217 [Bacteroides fragilis str. 2-F-2 \